MRHVGTDDDVSARDVLNEVGAGLKYCVVKREHAGKIEHDVAEILIMPTHRQIVHSIRVVQM